VYNPCIEEVDVAILVTGGTGGLGRHVVRRLSELGHDVLVGDIAEPTRELPRGAEFALLDVCDRTALSDVFRRHDVEAVAHLSGVISGAAKHDPDRAVAVNVLGTLNVLEAAHESGLHHVVEISSKAVVGPLTGRHGYPYYEPVPASIERRPTNLYGMTKLCLEQLSERFCHDTGLAVTALRLATLYGPGKAGGTRDQFGFVGKIIERVFAGEAIEVTGGDERNDLLYVADMAQSVVRALECGLDGYRMFQIGAGAAYSMYELADALRAVEPSARIGVGPGLDPSGRGPGSYYVFDIEPARRELGYEPQFDLTRGVADYHAAYHCG
jgi:UDP-glucose 4-epimerase